MVTIFEQCNIGVKANETQQGNVVVHLAFGVTLESLIHGRHQDDMPGKTYIVPFEPEAAIAMGESMIEQGNAAMAEGNGDGGIEPASTIPTDPAARHKMQEQAKKKGKARRPKR